MQATGEDLHAALVAVTLLLGVVVASDPSRGALIQRFRLSLEALDQEPEWSAVAARAKAYGDSMIANMQKQQLSS
jgi:hypothetical protein